MKYTVKGLLLFFFN